MKTFAKRTYKAIGALLGAATGTAVITVAGVYDVSVDPELAGAIAMVLAYVGSYIAPKNEDPVS